MHFVASKNELKLLSNPWEICAQSMNISWSINAYVFISYDVGNPKRIRGHSMAIIRGQSVDNL